MLLLLQTVANCDIPQLTAARALLAAQSSSPSCFSGALLWHYLSRCVLKPSLPFQTHQMILQSTYQRWSTEDQGPYPLWFPTLKEALETNVARFMAGFQGDADYRAQRTGDPIRDWPLLHRTSVTQPELFWPALLTHLGVRFETPTTRTLMWTEGTNPDEAVWFPGARYNAGLCALNCPAAGPDDAAIVWAEEGKPEVLHHVSRAQLRQRCYDLAAIISTKFKPGTAIAIDMAMTVDAVVVYLAIVLAGCAVVSVADSFSAQEVATRLTIAKAAAVFTQDVILRGGKSLPLYARLCEWRDLPWAVVLPAREGQPLQVPLRPGDVSWSGFLSLGDESLRRSWQPHVCDIHDTCNILFSSGTTGEPKAIPWSHITPLRCRVDGWAHQDLKAGDRACWPTSMGWMMGPWLVYAALGNGGAIVLYQGAPLGADFLRFVAAARVTMLGVVPSIVKAWRGGGVADQVAVSSSIRCFASTGEASTPEDYHWLMAVSGYKPIIEYCGGTEIGGGFMTSVLLRPQSPSVFTTPSLGCNLVLLGPSGRQSSHWGGEPFTGEVALQAPLMGASQRLLNKDHFQVYYEGMPRTLHSSTLLRRHGDEMARLPGGMYVALGRCDDTMNLGGIKVSSVELERAVMAAVPERLLLFLVIQGGADSSTARLKSSCQRAVSSSLNPLFKIEEVVLRTSLPRTSSNKVMRRVLRDEMMAAASKPQRAKL